MMKTANLFLLDAKPLHHTRHGERPPQPDRAGEELGPLAERLRDGDESILPKLSCVTLVKLKVSKGLVAAQHVGECACAGGPRVAAAQGEAAEGAVAVGERLGEEERGLVVDVGKVEVGQGAVLAQHHSHLLHPLRPDGVVVEIQRGERSVVEQRHAAEILHAFEVKVHSADSQVRQGARLNQTLREAADANRPADLGASEVKRGEGGVVQQVPPRVLGAEVVGEEGVGAEAERPEASVVARSHNEVDVPVDVVLEAQRQVELLEVGVRVQDAEERLHALPLDAPAALAQIEAGERGVDLERLLEALQGVCCALHRDLAQHERAEGLGVLHRAADVRCGIGRGGEVGLEDELLELAAILHHVC
mmetsp:Transcript_30407/g.59398  ORF Transcript_30407/g.59398 Transcript_30407/m.59398 type:complete len:363 (-) Transcript_30407:525-1613(-)